MRPCYADMLDKLLDVEEDPCIENVAIGASSISIFLRALKQFCGDIVELNDDNFTYENRILYEVVLNVPSADTKPKIMIEAGQEAGSQSVMLALYIIEQLVACEEYNDMLNNAVWVILPCTNPDGQEYVRCNREPWKKNMMPIQDTLGFGVDISRNFDEAWKDCPTNDNVFSPDYPGSQPNSQNETQFITRMIEKHKAKLKAYISMRRDGHAILYPLASKAAFLQTTEEAKNKAGDIANKVNQRSGNIQWFKNSSIYDINGRAWCGHSVDYVFSKHFVKYAYEMRVFPETDNRIMSKFQILPKGYDTTLRNAYFSGIRELFNIVVNDAKH